MENLNSISKDPAVFVKSGYGEVMHYFVIIYAIFRKSKSVQKSSRVGLPSVLG